MKQILETISSNDAEVISKKRFLRSVQLNSEVQSLLSQNPRLKSLLNVTRLKSMFENIDENHDEEITLFELLHFASELKSKEA